jgi:hypothetical protein
MGSNGSLSRRAARYNVGPTLRKTSDCHAVIMGSSPHVGDISSLISDLLLSLLSTFHVYSLLPSLSHEITHSHSDSLHCWVITNSAVF